MRSRQQPKKAEVFYEPGRPFNRESSVWSKPYQEQYSFPATRLHTGRRTAVLTSQETEVCIEQISDRKVTRVATDK